jgi:hypothetical protein
VLQFRLGVLLVLFDVRAVATAAITRPAVLLAPLRLILIACNLILVGHKSLRS